MTKFQSFVKLNFPICIHLETDIYKRTKKASVLAKRELIYLGGTYGIAAWLAGMRFIDRASGQKGKDDMNRTMLDMKSKKEKLIVFPEGTRRNTGEIHEFKKGAFHAAVHAQIPIIPVVFGCYKHFFDSKKNLFGGGTIHLQVLPEIPTEGLTKDDVDDLIRRTREVMIEAYKKMN
jgi:lysophosphatidate acyltransferase